MNTIRWTQEEIGEAVGLTPEERNLTRTSIEGIAWEEAERGRKKAPGSPNTIRYKRPRVGRIRSEGPRGSRPLQAHQEKDGLTRQRNLGACHIARSSFGEHDNETSLRYPCGSLHPGEHRERCMRPSCNLETRISSHWLQQSPSDKHPHFQEFKRCIQRIFPRRNSLSQSTEHTEIRAFTAIPSPGLISLPQLAQYFLLLSSIDCIYA